MRSDVGSAGSGNYLLPSSEPSEMGEQRATGAALQNQSASVGSALATAPIETKMIVVVVKPFAYEIATDSPIYRRPSNSRSL